MVFLGDMLVLEKMLCIEFFPYARLPCLTGVNQCSICRFNGVLGSDFLNSVLRRSLFLTKYD